MAALRAAVLALAVAAAPAAESHLLEGARLFRAEQYAAALVEFRVAAALGAQEALWYSAASLLKLGRAEEAVEGFAEAAAAAPAARDGLLDYYRAQACHALRLYLCADALLASVAEQAGPRIGGHARTMRAAIAAELVPDRLPAAIDWYLARGRELAARRPLLAAAYLEEAAGLGLRLTSAYRRQEALDALAKLRGAPPSGKR
ncbi:MAG TPA: hypothetical protein VK454_07010 [Myxococcaceae bacterium]|nr:hypothetical protein [Myxococcaceae bacterium]